MFGWGPQKDSPTRAKEMTVEKEEECGPEDAWAPNFGASKQQSKKVSDNLKDTASRR